MSSLPSVISTFREYLNSRVAQQAVHAGNVTNVDTPNFRAKVPQFAAVLDSAAQQADASPWKMQLRVSASKQAPRNDGNNVNLEQEMAAIAENSLQYVSAVKLLSKQMGLMRYAISSSG